MSIDKLSQLGLTVEQATAALERFGRVGLSFDQLHIGLLSGTVTGRYRSEPNYQRIRAEEKVRDFHANYGTKGRKPWPFLVQP